MLPRSYDCEVLEDAAVESKKYCQAGSEKCAPCVGDSLLMVDKRQIAQDYDSFWEDGWCPSDNWTQFGNKPLRMQAVRFLPAAATGILDLGCGNGFALAALKKRGLAGIGCDISLRALEDASEYGDVVRADGCNLPFRDGSFQHVLLLDALEHVVEKEVLLRECHRVLAPEGEVILTTPLPKATGGRGDARQPYDKPATFREIIDMTSHLFRLLAGKGTGWMPRGLSRLARVVPNHVYVNFPMLLENSTEVLLRFERK